MSSGELVRELRRRNGLSVRALAEIAGVSPATVDRIEHGRVSPTSTVERIVTSLGYSLVMKAEPAYEVALTRGDRKSLAYHRLVAAKLLAEPDRVLAQAHRNLATMRRADKAGFSSRYFDEWEELLDGPEHGLVNVLLDTGEHARDLRQVAPFAGVLTPEERAAVYPVPEDRHVPASA